MAATSPDPPTPPQVVPRPPDARPGAPAPGADLSPSARADIGFGRVLAALEGAAQAGPPPATGHIGPDGPPAPGARASAVLVPLFEEDGEVRVILTRRSSALRAHRGEVSFPGGRIEAGEDAPTAARREAHEEIGLPPAASEVVGWLHPLHTVASTSFITPVVGRLEARPRLVANPAEVERVFDVTLAALVRDGAFHEERWRLARELLPETLPADAVPERITVWFFEAAGETVWGATARMLHELLSLVLGVAPAAR